jgi:hypothetical protein
MPPVPPTAKVAEFPSQNSGVDSAMNMRGGETIDLWLPFVFQGRTIDKVVFRPFVYDDLIRWTDGGFENQRQLMVELIDGLDEPVIRQLRYQDLQRVLTAFFRILPEEITEQIRSGGVPRLVDVTAPDEGRPADEGYEPPAEHPERPPDQPEYDEGGVDIEPR